MKLLTKDIRNRLTKNGLLRQRMANANSPTEPDFLPVAKLFTPDGAATWLLTKIDPDDEDRAFGLCDLGLGMPELGYVSLSELARLRGQLGLSVERDRYFTPTKSLSAYTEGARIHGSIKA